MVSTFASVKLNFEEIEEAMSSLNLYYCWKALECPPRNPTVVEALSYYVKNIRNPAQPIHFFEVEDTEPLFV